MKNSISILCASLLSVTASASENFGKTYGECLELKGEGGQDACQRRFEGAPHAEGTLSASGYMMRNQDGSASFEFRIANDRSDFLVTGFTVTATFYRDKVSAESKVATYHWSFRSPVAPKSQVLEYGKLHAKETPGLTDIYTYSVKVDTEVRTKL